MTCFEIEFVLILKNFVCFKYLGIKKSGCQNMEIEYNDFSAWSVGFDKYKMKHNNCNLVHFQNEVI